MDTIRKTDGGPMAKRVEVVEVPSQDGREWHVKVSGLTRGKVRLTLGGFFRASNFTSGISYGPIFSLLGAAQFARGSARYFARRAS